MHVVVMPQQFVRPTTIHVHVPTKDVHDVCRVVALRMEALMKQAVDKLVADEIARRVSRKGLLRLFRGSLNPETVRKQLGAELRFEATIEFRTIKSSIAQCMYHSQPTQSGGLAVQQKDWALVLRAYWKYCV